MKKYTIPTEEQISAFWNTVFISAPLLDELFLFSDDWSFVGNSMIIDDINVSSS